MGLNPDVTARHIAVAPTGPVIRHGKRIHISTESTGVKILRANRLEQHWITSGTGIVQKHSHKSSLSLLIPRGWKSTEPLVRHLRTHTNIPCNMHTRCNKTQSMAWHVCTSRKKGRVPQIVVNSFSMDEAAATVEANEPIHIYGADIEWVGLAWEREREIGKY